MAAEIPEVAIQAAAEVLHRQYASEYSADHLTWRDFADPAREILAACYPAAVAEVDLAELASVTEDRDKLRSVVLEMAAAIRADMNGNGRIARSEVTDWCTQAGVEFDIHADEDDDE